MGMCLTGNAHPHRKCTRGLLKVEEAILWFFVKTLKNNEVRAANDDGKQFQSRLAAFLVASPIMQAGSNILHI